MRFERDRFMGILKPPLEQLPVEIANQIAEQVPSDNANAKDVVNDTLSPETKGEVACCKEGWRELAQRVELERDPKKMIALVQQLILTFDEEKSRRRLQPTRNG
jgi:hypothetical protein